MEWLKDIVTQISGHLVDVYKHKSGLSHDKYIAELEHATREAERRHVASESALRREFQAAEAAKRREHEIQMTWERARVELWSLAEKDLYEARKAIRPFSVTPDYLTMILRDASHDGEQPLLLFSSFSDELRSAAQSDTGPQQYRFGLRNSWAASPWSDDAAPLDGLFSRPLYRGDLDVYLVRAEIGDFPAVLVNGHIQAGARVWLTLSAWGILSDDAGIRIQFPYLDLPAVSRDDLQARRKAQLQIEDEICARFAPVAAQLFDWFHLTRHGRVPRLHRTLPAHLEDQRAVIAAGSLSGFFIAERDGVLAHLDALLGSARVAVEGGLGGLSDSLIRDIREALAAHPEWVSDSTAVGLAALGSAARASGDLGLTATVYEMLEQVTRNLLHDLPGGGL